jgi:hypothetical protein
MTVTNVRGSEQLAQTAELAPLHEYSFNAANGEPEGCEFAASHDEAARLWGHCLHNGDMRLLQVWGPGHDARWFRIERTRDGVEARECAQ